MAFWRISLLVLALMAPGPGWGEAPLTSPAPRARPATPGIDAAVAAALTAPPPRPPGAVPLSEAVAAEALAAQQAADAARHAAEAAQAARIEAERQVAERVAHDDDAGAAEISPLAVASSLFPRRRTASVVQRFATLAGIRAQARAEQQAAVAVPNRTGGPSGSGLCGVRGLAGRELPRITSSTQGCGIARPVSVTSVNGIPLSLAATLDCDAATAFERWVRTEALPAIGRTGGGVTQIRIMGHYSCRPRNNQRGARISEHGRGRAVDVGGFRLADGTVVTVEQHYRRGPYRRMMRQMYQAACGIFRTTLGPDSDRFHQDHFHFDVAQHRGGGTYCR